MLYLAMTATEIGGNFPVPFPIGYMACHFSAYGTGLSNLPQTLPAGSMLLVNDRTPVMGHSPDLIAQQLQQTAQELQCSRILLDFQRPGEAVTAQTVEAILDTAPCPVGVSAAYASGLSCPVFLPPLPLLQTPADYTAAWAGREIWMEAALDALTVTVTPAGSQLSPAPAAARPLPHFDETLMCHYSIALNEEAAIFTLQRSYDDLQKLLLCDSISCFVGLYQEFKGVL